LLSSIIDSIFYLKRRFVSFDPKIDSHKQNYNSIQSRTIDNQSQFYQN